MNDYLTVHSNGYITYCDALIASKIYNTAQSFLFSLIGSPAHVQATSAHFFNGGICRFSDTQNAEFELSRWSGPVHSIRAKKIGDIVNKVMISTDHFPGVVEAATNSLTSAVVFGPDLATVKDRAFLRLNHSSPIPMKPEWREWLWEEILHPERLFSFGNRQLQESWSITWQEETLEESILEGIRQHYLN